MRRTAQAAATLLLCLVNSVHAAETGAPWKNGTGEPSGCVVNDNTAAAASAAVNTFQVTRCDVSGAQFSNGESLKASYSVAVAAYAGYASATDISCLLNGGGKVGRLVRVAASGRAAAAAAFDILLIKRSTLGSGGTPTALTAGAHDSADSAASLAVFTYASAPAVGTQVAIYRAQQTILIPAGTAAAYNPVEFLFGVTNDKSLVLRSFQGVCLNMNGTSAPAGMALNIEWKWTEE